MQTRLILSPFRFIDSPERGPVAFVMVLLFQLHAKGIICAARPKYGTIGLVDGQGIPARFCL